MAKSRGSDTAEQGPLNPRDFGIDKVPEHIAIIMDGNGRWANAKGRPRLFGHKEGANAVRRTLRASYRLGVRYLTLYAFSAQNWGRPKGEVDGLMSLLLHHVRVEQEELLDLGIRFRALGNIDRLPPDVAREVRLLEERSADMTKMDLIVALSYGGREEIVDAARSLARDAAAGKLDPSDIELETMASRMYTAGVPDPDLMIRTSGELRLSNFMLWQLAYAELYVTDLYWPDFGLEPLTDAMVAYNSRQRRFGKPVSRSRRASSRVLLKPPTLPSMETTQRSDAHSLRMVPLARRHLRRAHVWASDRRSKDALLGPVPKTGEDLAMPSTATTLVMEVGAVQRAVGLIRVVRVVERGQAVASFEVVVSPQFRGRGYATSALRWLMDNLLDLVGTDIVKVGVFEDNGTARRIYAELGFHELDSMWLDVDGERRRALTLSNRPSLFVRRRIGF